MITSSPDTSLGDFLLTSSAMSSTDTFDLSYCLAINAGCYSPLLGISVSVHSLPSVSSADSIPPIPINNNLAQKIHMETYLSLYQSNYLDSPTSPLINDDLNKNSGIRDLLAAPTVPRLRCMVKETLHIKKWLNGLVPNTAFSIRNRRLGEPSVWKAEGSLYSPEEYDALRGRPPQRTCERARRSKLRRNALFFERGTRSGTGRGTTISVRLPPMEATRNLSNLGRLDPALDMNSGGKTLHVDAPCFPITPRLMVSTSDAIFPISLESSSDVPDKAPQTLAARRGKKTLPHLSLNQYPDDEDYPSIPTAFLGASNCLPTGHIEHLVDTHMDLDSMISTLQSRRISGPFLPANITKGDSYSVQDKLSMGQGFDSDRYAQAGAVTAEYGDLSLGSSSCPTTASYVVSSTGISEPDSLDVSSEDLSMSQFTTVDIHARVGGALSKPPLHKAPSNDAKGVLPGCHKVRFGSLPNRQWESTQMRRQLDLDKYIPLVNSTRIQVPQATTSKGMRRPSTISTAASAGRYRPPIPFKSTNRAIPATHKFDLSARPASTPGNTSIGRTTESNKFGPQRHTIAQPKAAVTPLSRLRAVTNARVTAEKENNKKLASPPALKTVEENVGQKNGSVGQSIREASAKKKLQGPLRNIFTKLK